jgi:hypothetical protein
VRAHNPIRAAALIVVAITSAYVMWMGWWHTQILSSPDWCAKAIQAGRITPNASFQGLTTCTALLTIQLKATATNSHIYAGVVALCLLVLVVIVIAGGKLSFKADETGVGADIGSSSVPVAAQAVADSAQTTADVIKGTQQ